MGKGSQMNVVEEPTCGALWITTGRTHQARDRCGRHAPFVMYISTLRLRLCKYHRNLLASRLERIWEPFRVEEPKPAARHNSDAH